MKVQHYIPFLAGILLLGACTDDDTKVAFGTDTDHISIGAGGGVRTIRVTANGDWTATTDTGNTWITISPANGRGSTQVELLIDSALLTTARSGVVRIQSMTGYDDREIRVEQEGFDYAISLEDTDIKVDNYAAFGTRHFDVFVETNVDFDIEVPTTASWLTYDRYKVELDRGVRPRKVKVRFNWNINSVPLERLAEVVFKPRQEVELTRHDKLTVKQEAAQPIDENTRSGDSVALLGIARSVGMWHPWDSSVKMDEWNDVQLWEEGMPGYTPDKKGRVRYARFFMLTTKEGLPYEVQYLTAADELVFYGNSNAHTLNLEVGEYITKLKQLKRLTVAAYGLSKLHPDMVGMKNLEQLSLGGNNFDKVPDILTPENFPNLRSLEMGACQRYTIYDLSNDVREDIAGLSAEEGFPERLLAWNKLDTLILSVNFLQGTLPAMEHHEKWTAAEVNAVDTLPQKLIGLPRVLPTTKHLAINYNRLYGKLPDWLLYHPALDWWLPYTFIFNQEGTAKNGTKAGFDNEPVNLNYYYEVYTEKHPDIEEGEEETPEVNPTTLK